MVGIVKWILNLEKRQIFENISQIYLYIRKLTTHSKKCFKY